MSTDHFSGHAADYARHRPDYPAELFAWIASQCAANDQAWDCGTGNGQAAIGLANYFRHIHATDLSAGQIDNAPYHPRITYRATPAHFSLLAAASCDLVTVAQALHWFCNDAFYAEVKRVLKPTGIMVAWTYTLLRGDPELNTLIEQFHDHTVGPWWPPERRWVNRGYCDLPFPFAEADAAAIPEFEIRLEWNQAELLAYLRTWTATQRCMKETGADPCVQFGQQLRRIWPDPAVRKTLSWPLALRVGRMA